MDTKKLVLVTIVAEAVLEPRLVALVRDAGATGYTTSECRGEGSRGLRTGAMPGGNVRVEAIASPEIADRIVGELAASWFASYAVIAWLSEVSVVRGEKYVKD